MCGGELEIIPCSRVGHIFRKRQPYTFPGGVDQILVRNNMRLAEVMVGFIRRELFLFPLYCGFTPSLVLSPFAFFSLLFPFSHSKAWMDGYKEHYYAKRPDIKKRSYGDISERLALRKNLQCHSFEWYLNHVYSELPLPNENLFHGGSVSLNCNEQFMQGEKCRSWRLLVGWIAADSQPWVQSLSRFLWPARWWSSGPLYLPWASRQSGQSTPPFLPPSLPSSPFTSPSPFSSPSPSFSLSLFLPVSLLLAIKCFSHRILVLLTRERFSWKMICAWMWAAAVRALALTYSTAMVWEETKNGPTTMR